MQENGQEDDPPEPVRNDEAGGNRDPVKERMNHQTQQHRKSLMGRNELVGMRLLAKMEVRSHRVLEEVNDQISNQYQKRGTAPSERQAFGNDLHGGGGEHKARPKRHKISEIGPVPIFLHDDRAAKHIGRSRGQSQQQTEKNWVH